MHERDDAGAAGKSDTMKSAPAMKSPGHVGVEAKTCGAALRGATTPSASPSGATGGAGASGSGTTRGAKK